MSSIYLGDGMALSGTVLTGEQCPGYRLRASKRGVSDFKDVRSPETQLSRGHPAGWNWFLVTS